MQHTQADAVVSFVNHAPSYVKTIWSFEVLSLDRHGLNVFRMSKDIYKIMNAMKGEGDAHVIYAIVTKQSTTFKYNDKLVSEGHNSMISHFINFSCTNYLTLNDVSIPTYTKLPDDYYFCTAIIEEPTKINPCWTML